jgi:hypothetical protein
MKVDIIWLASVIAALTTIFGMAWKLHSFLTRIEKKIEQYDATLSDNTVYILRIALLSDDLPIMDRVQAGKKYIELGGNGYGHIVYNRLIKELEENAPTAHI